MCTILKILSVELKGFFYEKKQSKKSMLLKNISISPDRFGISDKDPIYLTYQVFGKDLGTAPIVLVNHALTGNSLVTGEKGWWKTLVGEGKTMDTNCFTVLAFDIPGNGFDGISEHLIGNYQQYTTEIMAKIFWRGLELLGITELYAIIGGSIGGAIGWEMFFQKPGQIQLLIPIATHYKASDWLIGNVLVQDRILNHSDHPVADARMHAMLLYRTPHSFDVKFQQKYNEAEQQTEVESWLKYHGNTLQHRFPLKSYQLMNHLLKTIGHHTSEKDLEEIVKKSVATIHLIAVDSDYMFPAEHQKKAFEFLKKYKKNVFYDSVQSIHGHDAFLIEYEQLHHFIKDYFKKQAL